MADDAAPLPTGPIDATVGRGGRRRRLVRRVVVTGAVIALVGLALTRWLVARAEDRYPRLGELVTVDGLRQHVLRRGTGERTLVLVHGAYGGLQDFAATILDTCARDYSCVAWDRPGHGYSERGDGVVDPGAQADVLLELLDELTIDRPILVGFSYGGAVVLTAALRAPERIAAVVMLNGPSHPWPDPLAFEHRVPAIPVLGRAISETWLTPIASLVAAHGAVANAFSPRPVPPAFASSPLDLALRPPSLRANAEDIRVLKSFLTAQRPRYAELDVPVVMLVSEQDRVVSPTIHSHQLVDEAPRVTVRRLDDAGHQVLYTHPEAVLDAIRAAVRVSR